MAGGRRRCRAVSNELQPDRASRRFALLLLVFVVAIGQSAEAAIRFKRMGEETLGGADALAGVREACEVDARRVWVEVAGRGECIAFHATPGFGTQSEAVLYFEGDIPSSYRNNAERLNGHLNSLKRTLETLASTYQVPYAMVARPGTFGSTGNHRDRRNEREAVVMREAVEAIRKRYGLTRVSLAGQSGGATIVGALLTLGLAHVNCAVPGSGGFDLHAMLDWHAAKQGNVGRHREHPAMLSGSYNVMDAISGIRPDPKRRVFVLGDEGDRVTPFEQQARFAERLKAAGHHAELLRAQGRGGERHGLTLVSLRVAGLCARGASDAEIRRAVSP